MSLFSNHKFGRSSGSKAKSSSSRIMQVREKMPQRNPGEKMFIAIVAAAITIISFFYAGLLNDRHGGKAFSGTGDGTIFIPYEIATCDQLQEMRDDLDANYALVANIDCTASSSWNSGAGFEPIGTSSSPFIGSLEGYNFTINGLTINRPSSTQPVGIFGQLGNTADTQSISRQFVRSVLITNLSIVGGTANTGGLVGHSINAAIEKVQINSGSVSANTSTQFVGSGISDNTAGGLVGYFELQCSSNQNHYCPNTGIRNSSYHGSINSGNVAGGLVGKLAAHNGIQYPIITINNSYADATTILTGSGNQAGGLVGVMGDGYLSNTYASGSISDNLGNTQKDIGGLIGRVEDWVGQDGSYTFGGNFSLTTLTAGAGGAIGRSADPSISPVIYFDISRSGSNTCSSTGAGYAGCIGVNSGNSQPNYFFNNTSNSPLNIFDFVNIWDTQTSAAPKHKAQTPFTTPDEVTALYKSAQDQSSVTVTWLPPANDGNSDTIVTADNTHYVTGYTVQYRAQGDINWLTAYRNTSSSYYQTGTGSPSPVHHITGLQPNTTYEVRVAAFSPLGQSAWSNTITASTAPNFSGTGAGLPTNPYIITNCNQLQEINNDLDAHYALGNNIDCSGTSSWNSGEGFSPIGDYKIIGPTGYASGFSGTLDGRNYTIQSLYVNQSSRAGVTAYPNGYFCCSLITSYVGLFDTLNSAVVVNLSFSGGSLVAGNTKNGTTLASTIAGHENGSTVQNISSNADVSGGFTTGGLIGGAAGNYDASTNFAYGGSAIPAPFRTTLERLSFFGNVSPGTMSGYKPTGQIIGNSNSVKLRDSVASGTTTCGQHDYTPACGGIVGSENNSTLERVAFTGTMGYSFSPIGSGMIGSYSDTHMTDQTNITDSFSSVTSSSMTPKCSGLIYYVNQLINGPSISDSFYNGTGCSSTATYGTRINSTSYFQGNSTNPPFNNWDFNGYWQQNTASYPTLKSQGIPGAPLTLFGNWQNINDFKLRWVVQQDNGGSTITDYLVEYKLSSDTNWTTLTHAPLGGNDNVTVPNLDGTQSYDFRISAINAIGQSAPTSYTAQAQTNINPTPPSEPIGLFGEGVSVSQIRISWAEPISNGNSPITNYSIQYRPTLGDGSWISYGYVPASGLTRIIPSLNTNTSYDFRVAAVNAIGVGAWSDIASAATNPSGSPVPDDPPPEPSIGTPQNLNATPQISRVDLNWDDVVGADHYVIEYKVSSDSSWTVANDTYSSSATISGLATNTSYDFRVAAINSSSEQGGWATTNTTTLTQSTYHITNCAELQGIMINPYTFQPGDSTGNYILDNDIDCSETATWTWDGFIPITPDEPLGFLGISDMTNGQPFTGSFDGQGHTISNVYQDLQGLAPFSGIFAIVTGSTIENVTFSNATLKGTTTNVLGNGGNGLAQNAGLVNAGMAVAIENVHFTGLDMTTYPGVNAGLAGMLSMGSIVENSSVTGTTTTGEPFVYGKLNRPSGIARDTNNNIYVADTFNSRIQKFDSNGQYLLTIGSPDIQDYNYSIAEPKDVVVDAAGNIFAVDTDEHEIKKYDSSGNYLTKWGSYGSGNGEFIYPASIAVDSFGNILVADSYNSRVQKFDNNGNYISQFGSMGSGNGQFGNYLYIAIDNADNIYIADQDYSRIQKFDSNGNYIFQFGTSGTGNGEFENIGNIAIAPNGHIYATDNEYRIQEFLSDGTYLNSWANQGSTDGSFMTIGDIVINSSGQMIISDYDTNFIQKLSSNGDFISKWGGWGNVPYSGGYVIGGLVGGTDIGSSSGDATTINQSFTDLDIDLDVPDFVGQSMVGGLTGGGNLEINNTYTKGDINVAIQDLTYFTGAGGISGQIAQGSINNSYASGAVTVTGDNIFSGVGGLVGFTYGDINDSFAMGDVTGSTDFYGSVEVNPGGLIGIAGAINQNDPFPIINNNYYDQFRSTQLECVGVYLYLQTEEEGSAPTNDCSTVNNSNNQPNYFFNNIINAPLTSWDFTNIWKTNATAPPDFAGSGTPIGPTAPSVPQNLTTTTITSSSIGIQWQTPASNGGSAITDYSVQYRLSNGGDWVVFNDGINTNLNANITGLSQSTSYDIRVAAINNAGQSSFTSPITASTSSNILPSEPRNLIATNYQYIVPSLGAGPLVLPHLSWDSPATGSPFTDYVIEFKLQGETNWRNYTDGQSTSTNQDFEFGFDGMDFQNSNNNTPEQNALFNEVVDGIIFGQTYEFRVAGVNAVGQGPFTQPISYVPALTASDCQLLHDLLAMYGITNDDIAINPHFVLFQDIDCSDTVNWNSGAGWSPIVTTEDYYFSGTFDGQGHSISNMFINNDDEVPVGMFGITMHASIGNLTLDNSNISGSLSLYGDDGDSGARVGALVGIARSDTDISDITASGSVFSGYAGGGLVGYSEAFVDDTNLSNINSHVNVTSKKETYGGGPAGGIIGEIYGGDRGLGNFSNSDFEIDSLGNVYTINSYSTNNKILQFNPSGQLTSSWGTGNDFGYGPDEMAMDSNDNLNFLGIKKFSGTGTPLSQYNYSGQHLYADHAGNLYLTGSTDYFWNGTPKAIQKIGSDGTLLAEFYTKDEIPGHIDDQINDLAVAPNGDIFVSAKYNSNVRHYNSNGILLGSFELGGANYGNRLVIGQDGKLYAFNSIGIYKYDLSGNLELTIPSITYSDSVSVDEDGNIYVARSQTHDVTKYSSTGTVLGLIEPGYSAGAVISPNKLIIKDNNLYVADYYQSYVTVKVFDKNTLTYLRKIDGKEDNNPYKVNITNSSADGHLNAKFAGGAVGMQRGDYTLIDDPNEIPGLAIEGVSTNTSINNDCQIAGGIIGITLAGTDINTSNAQGNFSCQGGNYLDTSTQVKIAVGGISGFQGYYSALHISNSTFNGDIAAAPYNNDDSTVYAGGMVGISSSNIGYTYPSDIIPGDYLNKRGLVINGGSVSANVHTSIAKNGGGSGGAIGDAESAVLNGITVHGSVLTDQMGLPRTTGSEYAAGGVIGRSRIIDIESVSANNSVNTYTPEGVSTIFAGGILGVSDVYQNFSNVTRSGDITIDGRADIPTSGSISTMAGGGLIGSATSYDESRFENSTSSSNISLNGVRGGDLNYGARAGSAGGLIGSAESRIALNIINSSSSGNIMTQSGLPDQDSHRYFYGSASLGGLVGSFRSSFNSTGEINVADSHSSASVSGPAFSLGGAYAGLGGGSGGLVGLIVSASGGSIERSFSTGNVDSSYAGGLVGNILGGTTVNSSDNLFTIKNTYSTSAVTAQDFYIDTELDGQPIKAGFSGIAGGLIGGSSGVNIENSYSSGIVRASNGVDYTGFEISSTYDLIGSMTPKGSIAGGLIGQYSQNYYSMLPPDYDTFYIANSYIKNSFTTSKVEGPSSGNKGSLVGIFYDYLSIALPLSGNAINLDPNLLITPEESLENNYYDMNRVDQNVCSNEYLLVSFDPPATQNGMPTNVITDTRPVNDCQVVNTDGTQPNYFINNHTNPPLNVWDFTSVWKTNYNTYPDFIGSIEPQTPPPPPPPPQPPAPSPSPTSTPSPTPTQSPSSTVSPSNSPTVSPNAGGSGSHSAKPTSTPSTTQISDRDGSLLKKISAFIGALAPSALMIGNSLLLLLLLLAIFYLYQSWREYQAQARLKKITARYQTTKQLRDDFTNIASHYLNTPIQIMQGSVELARNTLPTMQSQLNSLDASLRIMAEDTKAILNSINEPPNPISHTIETTKVDSWVGLLRRPGLWLPIVSTAILLIIFDVTVLLVGKMGGNPYILGIQICFFIFVCAILIFTYRAKVRLKRLSQQAEYTLSLTRSLDKDRINFIKTTTRQLQEDLDAIRTSAHRLIATGKVPNFASGLGMAEGTLLNLKRIESATDQPAETPPTIMTPWLDENIPKIKVFVEESDLAFEAQTDRNIAIALPVDSLAQLIGSLIGNAVKFTPSGGKVTLSLSQKGDNAHLLVADTGAGIDPEKAKSLFQPFSRGTSSLTYDYEGAGLSLYINKLIVDRAGGTIKVESKPKNGTSVHVTLPINKL